MRHILEVHDLQPRRRTLNRRTYLTTIVPAHRKALTRLFVSSHILAVEVLRWGERYRPKIPREWRLCRFCKIAVEDEVHALLLAAFPLGAEISAICTSCTGGFWSDSDIRRTGITLEIC
ncbi:uncharacterized protein EV420DRAFT_1576985 [Desarmillaria tabescens]|uniref:Uncharacterized protein n=1 Tax=Armillaria tabescens TaxID=1929756 RepID=A0AA39MR25_ARMTA|nr:uncharacterized protein EV420DRAFT_1576985 [Desarmillaria tabescens]KAK0443103.1 hypothetical protein EV420DRAFT_1576985 [Desarmillaria tabescens]